MPQYGVSLDASTQDRLAAIWAKAWGYVYPGTKWLTMSETVQRMQASGVLRLWSEQEKAFMQTGLLEPGLVDAICDATKTEAVMQVTVYHAQAGSGSTSFLFRPLFGSGNETAGAARLAAVLYDCKIPNKVWQASQETSYSGNYTQLQFIEYALYDLAAKSPK